MFQTLHFQKKQKIIDKEYLIAILKKTNTNHKTNTPSICSQSWKTVLYATHQKKSCIQFLELVIYRQRSMTAAVTNNQVKIVSYKELMWSKGKLLPKYLVPLYVALGTVIDQLPLLTACRLALIGNALSQWQTNDMGEMAAINFTHLNWILGKTQGKSTVLHQSLFLFLPAVHLFAYCRLEKWNLWRTP